VSPSLSAFPSFFGFGFKHKPLYFQPLFGFVGMRFSSLPYSGSSFCHIKYFMNKINLF